MAAGAGAVVLVLIPVRSRAFPSLPLRARVLVAGVGDGVPTYSGIVYCQRTILECIFSTSNDSQARNSTRFLRKRKLAKFFSRKRLLAKFFMGDLCVNANQH